MEPWTLKLEAWRLKMAAWRVCRLLVAESLKRWGSETLIFDQVFYIKFVQVFKNVVFTSGL
jgi:hypothetical protein